MPLHSRPPPVGTIRIAQTEPFFVSSDFDTISICVLRFDGKSCSSCVCGGSNLYVHAVRPPTCAPSRMCTHLESRVTHSRATPSPLFCADDLVPSSACADLNGDPRTSYFRWDEMKRAQGQVLLGRSRLLQVSHEPPELPQTAFPPLSA